MNDTKAEVEDFLEKCELLRKSKFIMATTRIKDILKSIVNSNAVWTLPCRNRKIWLYYCKAQISSDLSGRIFDEEYARPAREPCRKTGVHILPACGIWPRFHQLQQFFAALFCRGRQLFFLVPFILRYRNRQYGRAYFWPLPRGVGR